VTLWCGIIGALAISAFPLTSGFTTKGMVDQAVSLHAAALTDGGAASARFVWVWLGLEIASAGVFLHAGIKFPWFVFFNGETNVQATDPPLAQRMAMIAMAALCIAIGVFPQPLYAILPTGAASELFWPHAYSLSHVVEMLCLLVFSGAAFFVLLPALQRTRTITLDLDWLWRRFPRLLWRELVSPFLQDWHPALHRARRRVAVALGRVRAPGRFVAPASVILAMLVVYLILFLLRPVAWGAPP
jgi:multicomponent Na+:H+ antiporter subunit D